MGNMNEYEFEEELNEFEAAGEAGEGEGILGALGGLFGEEELEQHEHGELHELHEMEAGELHELGELHESGELHELEGLHELGELHEMGELHEFEYEGGEQFFGRIAKFVKRAAPLLKTIAKVAAPMVGTAIGGPFGAVLGKVASAALGEGELHELEEEYELHEYEHPESAHEVAHEIAQHETAVHEAYAEMLAEAAAQEHSEGQAEAMAGAAVVSVLSQADRRALRRILPHLVRGAAILTRVLRRRRVTRPYVRTVPTIMRRTVRTLKRQAAAGRPITRRAAATAAATQVRRVLGNPNACAAAIQKNVIASRRMSSPRRRPIAG
ncbi:hypothetical protein PPGU19_065840 (plasmid) [Paraburkholderia sp. PGU19]|uniref:hypothetical protein n=1 Tax=Paraburkholderia sp. PGU19 TaxID=2735434 RepID=UPI0015DA2235|nr:hypothetical protein [Paraburkholderia sp. PGU19]BCG02016.1 hypothetical protein PPGU19_065840 [Paraburkholderia sp. PGU19]